MYMYIYIVFRSVFQQKIENNNALASSYFSKTQTWNMFSFLLGLKCLTQEHTFKLIVYRTLMILIDIF